VILNLMIQYFWGEKLKMKFNIYYSNIYLIVSSFRQKNS